MDRRKGAAAITLRAAVHYHLASPGEVLLVYRLLNV